MARTITYCLVPYELAAELHEPLREHFASDPSVEVVVERRGGERRLVEDRRRASSEAAAAEPERRLIRNEAGRRIGPRRSPVVSGAQLTLPRRARPYADRLVFVQRIEPAAEHMAELDSARLVTRFQSGDREAFSALYMRYFDFVYTYARTLFRGDSHAAEDLTQQVFVRALEALPRYEQRGRAFRSWLFTITRNRALSEWKARGRAEPVDPGMLDERREEEERAPEAPATLDWLMDRELVMFVERLPLAHRQVLVLKYMLDLPSREIAEVLGRSYVDVRTIEHRALRYLEARLVAVGRRSSHTRDRPLPSGRVVQRLPVFRRRRGALYRNPGRVRVG